MAVLTFGCTMTSNRQSRPPVFFKAPEFVFDPSIPPEQQHQQLNQYMDKDKSPSMNWWVRYQQAKLWEKHQAEKSCDLYFSLAQESKFPIKEIAHLRAVQICPLTKLTTMPDFNELKTQGWMKKFVLESELIAAERASDQAKLIGIYHEKSKLSLNKTEKVRHTRSALDLARVLNDEDQIALLESRLFNLAPRHKPQPTKLERLSIADDFRQHREFIAAKNIYEEIINDSASPDNHIYRALLGLRKTIKLENDHPGLLKVTERLVQYTKKKYKKEPKGGVERYKSMAILFARTLWTQGAPKKAATLLEKLALELKQKTSLEEVFWIRARIEEEEKNYAVASSWLEKALGECAAKCALQDRILWYKAWNLRKINQHEQAYQTLVHLSTQIGQENPARVTFWMGKLQREMKNDHAAIELFQQLAQTDSFGYYGILAQRELSQSIQPLGQMQIRGPASTTVPAAPADKLSGTKSYYLTKDGVFASWLVSLGEQELARNFLNESSKQFASKYPTELKFWHEVLSLYAQAEDYQGLMQRLWQIPSSTRESLLSFRPDLLFPKPYKDIVNAAAQKYMVPEDLIYSIIRQESAFDKHARSPADAFGLMQLLPSLAQNMSTAVSVPYQHAEDLYNPEINIPLGAAYLKSLWNKYDGQFVLITASYNASEKAIQNWVKHRFTGDPLEFIEDIPYGETQAYVKLVLRNFILYQRLKSDTAPMPFPEWCLEKIHPVNI